MHFFTGWSPRKLTRRLSGAIAIVGAGLLFTVAVSPTRAIAQDASSQFLERLNAGIWEYGSTLKCTTECKQEGRWSESRCQQWCGCAVSFLEHSFDASDGVPQEWQQFLKSSLWDRAADDAAMYCDASYRQDEGFTHSPIMGACLEDGETADTRRGAWCACVEDEISRFGLTEEFAEGLGAQGANSSFRRLLEQTSMSDPRIEYRVKACESGRSRYETEIMDIVARVGVQGLVDVKYCAAELQHIAERCEAGIGQVPSQNVRSCTSAVLSSNRKPCTGQRADDIAAYQRTVKSVQNVCGYWGGDVQLFKQELVDNSCLIASSDVQLRFRYEQVPQAAGLLAMGQVPGLTITDVARENANYVVKGNDGSSDFRVISKVDPNRFRARFREPNLSELELVEMRRYDLGMVDAWTMQKAMEVGELTYRHCRSCHGDDGRGVRGKGPRLTGLRKTRGSLEENLRLSLRGANHSHDQPFDIYSNPPRTNEDMAGLLSFYMTRFGRKGEVFVTPDQVSEMRKSLRSQ